MPRSDDENVNGEKYFELTAVTDDSTETQASTQDDEPIGSAQDVLLLLTSNENLPPPPILPQRQSQLPFNEYLSNANMAHLQGTLVSVMSDEESTEDISVQIKTDANVDSNCTRQIRKAVSCSDGNGPTDDVKMENDKLRAELAVMTQRMNYERLQKRLHVERSRKIYGQLKQMSAMVEQVTADGDRLHSQEIEIQQLIDALSELRQKSVSQRQEFHAKESQLNTRLQKLQGDNETLRSSLMASKRNEDELTVENRRLRKDLGTLVQRLFDKEAALIQLQEQCGRELPSARQTISQLNTDLFVMGERNRRLQKQLFSMKSCARDSELLRERLRNMENLWKQENSGYRRILRKERHKLDSSNQRIQELETQLQKRQTQLAESKRRWDQANELHKEQLEAFQMKYQALLTASQRQEIHILELYDKMENKCVDETNRRDVVERIEETDRVEYEERMENGDRGSVNIPIRSGTTPEIAVHHGSYCHGGTLAASFTSVGSQKSNDLYLPYLSNMEEQADTSARRVLEEDQNNEGPVESCASTDCSGET